MTPFEAIAFQITLPYIIRGKYWGRAYIPNRDRLFTVANLCGISNSPPMKRYYYGDQIASFLDKSPDSILGSLVASHQYPLEMMQRNAWLSQIGILKSVLLPYRDSGRIYFEFSIPRLGRRIDAVVILRGAILVMEFKVNEKEFTSSAVDQVCDYALDLKNFHETSHGLPIAPILVATDAMEASASSELGFYRDGILGPIKTNRTSLGPVVGKILAAIQFDAIDPSLWEAGRYCPTPTIIEAATSLYNGHSVADISRSDAAAINLTVTSDVISEIILDAKAHSKKVICFVTSVPGAGKTLVGLNIATKHIDRNNDLYSVFLSGNGPLVDILLSWHTVQVESVSPVLC